uniref:sorting nexin-20 n=1 Tax=Myodes glareolus TaxID=447135 RepID=UPI002021CF58|nr:sorting nexin-20 [Myodes glareolus]
MASLEHPGSPGWTGPIHQCTPRTRQEVLPSGPDLPCSGPEEHLETQDGPSSNSSMTTRELQEHWQKEKSRWRHVKLLFEIASARIEERRVSKFVMYQVVVVQTGSFDSNMAVVERRYSDFERLQKALLKRFGPELEDVAFPRKRLTGNLSAETICERRLDFAVGERALQRLRARESHRYYAPLLDAMVRLAYALGKDFASLQGRLDDSQLRSPTHRGFTLKELTVREYLS